MMTRREKKSITSILLYCTYNTYVCSEPIARYVSRVLRSEGKLSSYLANGHVQYLHLLGMVGIKSDVSGWDRQMDPFTT